MINKKLIEFGAVVKFLESVFCGDNNKLNNESIEIYYKILSSYPIERLRGAALFLAQTKKFKSFPSIAEIIEAIEGDINDLSILAWGELSRNPGGFDMPKFSDPDIKEALKDAFGGWKGFINSDQFDSRRSFIAAYSARKRKKRKEKLLSSKLLKELPEFKDD
jgi:hypothetical protein